MLAHTIHVALGRSDVGISHLCRCRDGDVLSAALTNQTLEIYSLREAGSAHLCHLRGAQGPVMDQLFRFEKDRFWLWTCSEEGYLQQWDIRSGEAIERFHYHAGLTCLAAREHVVAMGTEEGTICFVDMRKNELLREFTDAHDSAITQMAFHPKRRDAFFSASDDGMLSVFDFVHGLDEDASFMAGQNWDSISRFGFFGNQQERLWCLTAQHGLALWEWEEALKEDSQRGAVAYYQQPDTRQMLTSDHIQDVHYCLACFSEGDGLKLVGGDDDGALGIFTVFCSKQIKIAEQDFEFELLLKGGHQESVRCFLPWKEEMWVTAGADGRICVWKDAPPNEESSSAEEDTPRVITQKKEPQRMTPY